MADRWYVEGKKHFGLGDVAWKAAGGSTVRAFLLDLAIYTPDTNADEFLSAIPAGARVGGTGTGYNQGVPMTLIDAAADGVLDAQDTTFPAVPAGVPCGAIVIYKQGTSDADSVLLVLDDFAPGLPVTPSGADIKVEWENSGDFVARL